MNPDPRSAFDTSGQGKSKAMPSITLMMSAIFFEESFMPFMVSTTWATTSPPLIATTLVDRRAELLPLGEGWGEGVRRAGMGGGWLASGGSPHPRPLPEGEGVETADPAK